MKMREWAREHSLAFWLVFVAAVCLIADVILATNLSSDRNLVRRHGQQLARMEQIAAEHARLISQTPTVGGQALTLALVERAAAEKGVADRITNRSAENPAKAGEGLLMQSVRVSLSGVVPERLAHFLLGVESLSPGIRTRTLQISRTPKQAGLLDATVVFSAYETTTKK